MAHLLDAREDRARGRDVVDVPVRDRHQLAVHQSVRGGHVLHASQVLHAGLAPGHPERPEDPALDPLVPRRPRHLLSHLAGGQEHRVLVTGLRTEAGVRLEVPDPSHDLLAIEVGRVPVRIAPASQTASMGQDVADRDLAGHIRVEQLEPGQVIGHPIVPPDLALVDQDADSGGRERLRVGADGEQGVLIDRAPTPELPLAEPARVDDLPVLDDGDRQTHHPELVAHLLDVCIEIVGQRLCGRRESRQRRQDRRREPDPGQRAPLTSHRNLRPVPFGRSPRPTLRPRTWPFPRRSPAPRRGGRTSGGGGGDSASRRTRTRLPG